MSFEYVIKEDGLLFRRDITEKELEVTQAGLDQLGASIVRKATNLFITKEWGPTSIALSNDVSVVFLTTHLKRIPLRAPFKLAARKEEQFLVPEFAKEGAELMPMEWEAPEGMNLRFLQMCQVAETARASQRWHATKAWLFAGDKDGRQYRLPLPNIYDDCRICEGDWARYAATGQECVQKALAQFEKSEWNADLWRNPEATQSLFRFKAKKDGFDQLPPDEAWPSLCVKVSTDITKYLV